MVTNGRPTTPLLETVSIRIIESGEMTTHLSSLDALETAPGREDTITWVELVNPSAATLERLATTQDLPPQAIRGFHRHHRTSEATFLNGATAIVLHTPRLQNDTIGIAAVEIIICERLFVTIHRPGDVDIDAVLDTWDGLPAHWRATTSALLFAVLHVGVATYVPVIDAFDRTLDDLQQRAIEPSGGGAPSRQLLYDLFQVSEQIIALSGMADPTSEMMQSVVTNSDWFSGARANAYSRDVVDDASHNASRLRSLGDAAGRLFDMANSIIGLQSTDVAQRLTIVATIFLPLTMLSSYFGQNFGFMVDTVDGVQGFLIWGVAAPLLALGVILVLLWKFGAYR